MCLNLFYPKLTGQLILNFFYQLLEIPISTTLDFNCSYGLITLGILHFLRIKINFLFGNHYFFLIILEFLIEDMLFL